MRLITMPAPDLNADAHRAELRRDAARISALLAHAELRAAARILRHGFGVASKLLLEKDVYDDDSTKIEPLVLIDRDGELTWYNNADNARDAYDYPGAESLSDSRGRPYNDFDDDTLKTLIEHLTEGYDAAGGCSGALNPDGDDFFGTDINLLVLDIDAALKPFDPDKVIP